MRKAAEFKADQSIRTLAVDETRVRRMVADSGGSDVGELIVGGAYETGRLTHRAMESLLAVPDVAARIGAGLGQTPDNERVFLVSIVPDDSGSIFAKNNAPWVAQGHNDIVDELYSLSASESTDAILLHTRYLNGQVLNPYTALATARRMDYSTYREGGGTPLYDQSVVALGTVVAKTVQLTALGAKVRTFTLLISDGADKHSMRTNAQSVAWIVGDMLGTGEHIVAGMGVRDGVTDFRAVYREMGIKPGWILEVKDSRDAIRKAFRTISSKLTLAAGSEGGFAQLALGRGFE